jgi:hypothetical protein
MRYLANVSILNQITGIAISQNFIRLRRNTLQLAAGIKGRVKRAEAHQSEGALFLLYHFTLEWLRRNFAFIPRRLSQRSEDPAWRGCGELHFTNALPL